MAERSTHEEDQTQMHLKIEVLQQELEKREINLLNLTEEKDNLDMMVENFQNTSGNHSELLAAAEQEKENMKMIYAEKEATMKNNFANKVQKITMCK